MRLISKHLRKHPLCNLFIACEGVSKCAHCSTIPSDKLHFSRFIWDAWGGNIPNMVLSPEGDRYLSFGEHCSRNVDRGSDPLPPELAVSWRKCELCPCFYYRTANDLQRHVHLAHFASNSGLLDCDKTPFGCSYRLQRPLDEAGIPFGPFKYCGMRFSLQPRLL